MIELFGVKEAADILGITVLRAAGIAAAAECGAKCRKKKEKGECEYYYEWCKWGNREGHRPPDDPGKYWTPNADCAGCYAECKETGKWPFSKCKIGAPRWPYPVWPDPP